MLNHNKIIVGTLQNIYKTSKLAEEWNFRVIQDVSPADTHNRYNHIMNKPTWIMFYIFGTNGCIHMLPILNTGMHVTQWHIQNICRWRPAGHTSNRNKIKLSMQVRNTCDIRNVKKRKICRSHPIGLTQNTN